MKHTANHMNISTPPIPKLLVKATHNQQVSRPKVYSIKEYISYGAFSRVYTCENIRSKKIFAIKVFNKDHNSAETVYRAECSIMQKLRHPHIVQFITRFTDDTSYNIVTELLGKELFHYVCALGVKSKALKENTVKIVVQQLLSALVYIHSNDYVHRDIKLENVCLTKELDEENTADLHVKLIDFGFSYHISEQHTTDRGTPDYLAPEIIHKKFPQGTASDIWSLGVLMYIALCGYTPFGVYGCTTGSKQEMKIVMERIVKKQFTCDYNKWPNVSNEAKDLLSKMLVDNPSERHTAEKLLTHQWFS
jgi:calcium/calmodulin-dependent protein kinase-4